MADGGGRAVAAERGTAEPVGPTGSSLWSGDLRALTTGLVLTVTLAALESLAVATIMPIVSADLGGLELYGWVFSAFFLGDLVGIVAAGQQADRTGLVRPYLWGLGMFALGLTVAGLAPAMPVLVVGRFIQGFGAGAVPTVAYVSIRRQYPSRLRPRMFATLSTAWVVPGIVGPGIAGLVADHVTWRAVFLGLLPVIVIAAALTVPSLARVAPPVGAPAAAPGRLVAALRVAGGAALVLAALSASPPVLILLAVPGLALGLPALRRLLPPGTLRVRRGLPATVLVRGILTFGFFGAEAFLPLTLETIRGTSASVAGLALTGATLTWTVGSWTQAHRIAAWGAGRLIRAGAALVALGIAGIAAALDPDLPAAIGIAAWAVAGLGMGLAYASITVLVLHLAPDGREGETSAGLQLSDVLGTALGAGVAGAIVAAGAAAGIDPRLALLVSFALSGVAAAAGLAVGTRLGPASGPHAFGTARAAGAAD